MIMGDELAYAAMAESLAEGSGLQDSTGKVTTNYTPLLPLISAAAGLLTGDFIRASVLVAIVFGSLLLVPAFLLARRLFGSRPALMTAALLAVLPMMISYSSRIYTESILIFFFLLALFLGWRLLTEGRRIDGPLAGLALGLAYLANPAALIFLGLIAVLVLVVCKMKYGWRRALSSLMLLVLLFMVCAAPYIYFLHGQTGKWTLTGKGGGNSFTAFIGGQAGTPAWERAAHALDEDSGNIVISDTDLPSNPLQLVVTEPVKMAGFIAKEGYLLYSEKLQQIVPLWLLLPLGLGLFGIAWDRSQATRHLFLLLMVTPAALYLTVSSLPRYFAPFLAIAAIWIALGWQELERWGRQSITLSISGRWRQPFLLILPWFLAAVMLLPPLALTAFNLKDLEYPLGFRRAGEWVHAEYGDGHVVMNRNDSAAYYAGGRSVLLPVADYDDTTAYARRQGVDFLIIAQNELDNWRPELKVLLEPEGHPDWGLVAVIDQGSKDEVFVFRLQGDDSQGL